MEDEDKKVDPWEDETNEPTKYYLPRDTFEKTITQREVERASQQMRGGGDWASDKTY